MDRKDDNPRPPSVAERPGEDGGDEARRSSEGASGRSRPPPLPPDSGPGPSPGRPARNATPPVSLADARIGQTLVGRYRLDKLVGKGGMGRVYRATQFPLNRPVAVKILNPEFQKKDPQFVRRFFLEAASAARLSHPNTITVFDYGEAESGELFIAMEFLKGRPLSRVINAEGPFSGERVMHVAMQVCRALREAHTKGIIHRDLKPGNILLLSEGDDGEFVKVLDFGLVKLFNIDGEAMPEDPLTPEPPGELTKAGMFLGSPKYMSPEQIKGVPLDPRTDIYSLGVLMFQMATCKPPFTGATSVEVIYKHVNQPPPPLASFGADVPREVEEVIHRCLAKHPDDRFDSMNALLGRLKDVQRLLTGSSVATETGIEIDISDFSPSGSGPVLAPGGSESTDLPQVSLRPQTRPGRATPSQPGPPSASAIPRESAFADTGPLDDTGSGVLLESPAARVGRAAPWLAGAALVVVLGVLAFVLAGPGNSRSEPAARPSPGVIDEALEPPPPAVPMVEVTFTSDPAGASVFDDSGLSLGRTPLTTRLPRATGERAAFLFKLEGHAEVTKRVELTGAAVAVAAVLEPRAPDPQPGDEDYKANPY